MFNLQLLLGGGAVIVTGEFHFIRFLLGQLILNKVFCVGFIHLNKQYFSFGYYIIKD